MKRVIILNKKEGETPLEALESFRSKNSKYLNIPMTYAGRLDPMASGLLLILAGDETKNKEKYLVKDKEYEFEVLFGFATDTNNVLGKITRQEIVTFNKKELVKEIKNDLKNFIGEKMQKYPIYSSKTVKGKPLFSYARNGTEVEIPERRIFIYKFKFEKVREIDNIKLLKNIEKRVGRVRGDFRQKEILNIWDKNLNIKSFSSKKKFFIASFKVKCSSGTYVRVLADSIGLMMKIPALAFSIKRTKIGNICYNQKT